MRIRIFALLSIMITLVGCAATGPGRPSTSGAEIASPPDVDSPKASDNELSNTLRWATASEQDNFGFDVYRATTEEGPFECITEDPLLGAGTTDEPHTYVFVDDTNDPTKGYFYYLESITVDGVRERFSPIIHIGPKAAAKEHPED